MTTQETKQNEILQISGVLTALASAAGAVYENTDTDYFHAIVPQGFKLEDISQAVEKTQLTPLRKKGTVHLKELNSLLDYCENMVLWDDGEINGFIYADPDDCKITAVFNDHLRNPGWRDHRAVFKAEHTPEFKNWMDHNKSPMSQTEFAEFIEENFADITEPAAQSLLDVATTIQATTGINFSSSKRLQNGQVQLQYTEMIDARAGTNGALEIPKEFTLGLRIFKNGEGYKLKNRLKYRLSAGSVKFWYEIDRPERAIEDAFSGYVTTLREKSGYQVLLGAP